MTDELNDPGGSPFEDGSSYANGKAWPQLPADMSHGDVFGRDDRHVTTDDTVLRPPPWDSLVTPAPAPWFTEKPPARAWLLRDSRANGAGVLPLGKVGQLIAEGGAGKTMSLAQLAVCVATGSRFLGAFDPVYPGPDGKPAPGRVLLALGEEDCDEARRRLYRAARACKAPTPAEGSIVTLPLFGVGCSLIESDEDGNPADTSFAHWIRRYLVDHGPWALVILDPLSRFAGLNAETDNAAATRFIQSLESIAVATGATTIVSHHTNKLSRDGTGKLAASAGRGSSAFVDGARWQAGLAVEQLEIDDPEIRARLGEIVTFAVSKSNYSRKGEPIELRRDLENGGALVALDDNDRAIVQAAREARSGKRKEHTARTAAKEAERENVHAERDRKEAERRASRNSEREEVTRRRDAEDDDAARATLKAHPGASVRDLVAFVRKARACGSDRAHAAVRRVRGST